MRAPVEFPETLAASTAGGLAETKPAAAPAPFPAAEGDLEIRLARTVDDLKAVRRLRDDVYNLALRLGRAGSALSGLDRDLYDAYCDHLLVIDRGVEKVVGTYPLLPSTRRPSFGFHSETVFDIDNVKRSGLRLLELGRGCAVPGYRTGRVKTLLFRSIVAYARTHGIEALMGCAGIHGTGDAAPRRAWTLLRGKFYSEAGLRVIPRRGSDLPGQDGLPAVDEGAVFRMLPPLVKGYLRLGAKVCGPPAVDRQFGTTNFFLFAPIDAIPGGERRRSL